VVVDERERWRLGRDRFDHEHARYDNPLNRPVNPRTGAQRTGAAAGSGAVGSGATQQRTAVQRSAAAAPAARAPITVVR
jgi:hypothetical protein